MMEDRHIRRDDRRAQRGSGGSIRNEFFLSDASPDEVTRAVADLAGLRHVLDLLIQSLGDTGCFLEELVRPSLGDGDWLRAETEEDAPFPGLAGPWFHLGIHDAARFRREIRGRAARRLREQRPPLHQRFARLASRFGAPNRSERPRIFRPAVAAYDPGVGLLAVDRLERPRVVQLIIRDGQTGMRRSLAVPPRFADPRTATYQRLASPAGRVKAALAWTEQGLREWSRPQRRRPAPVRRSARNHEERTTQTGAVLITSNQLALLQGLYDRPAGTAPSTKDWIAAALPHMKRIHKTPSISPSRLPRCAPRVPVEWVTRRPAGTRLVCSLTARGRDILELRVPAHVLGIGAYRGMRHLP